MADRSRNFTSHVVPAEVDGGQLLQLEELRWDLTDELIFPEGDLLQVYEIFDHMGNFSGYPVFKQVYLAELVARHLHRKLTGEVIIIELEQIHQWQFEDTNWNRAVDKIAPDSDTINDLQAPISSGIEPKK